MMRVNEKKDKKTREDGLSIFALECSTRWHFHVKHSNPGKRILVGLDTRSSFIVLVRNTDFEFLETNFNSKVPKMKALFMFQSHIYI